jgi:hypothetical protein
VTARIWIAVLAAALILLHAMPWFPERYEPILFGAIPITIALWALWTVVVMLVLGWISFIYDPYAPVVRDIEHTGSHKGVGGDNESSHREEG